MKGHSSNVRTVAQQRRKSTWNETEEKGKTKEEKEGGKREEKRKGKKIRE